MAQRTPAAGPPRAVLFDSGGVLMQPIGGRWNPRADFEPTVLSHAPSITPGQFAAAIATGDEFMAAAASTPGLDDYHRVILRHLGVRPTPELLAELRRPVPPAAFLETFLRCRRRCVSCAAAAPGQCLFIDDDPDLATAAIRLGYHGRAICRDGQPPPGVPSIASLTEVLELL